MCNEAKLGWCHDGSLSESAARAGVRDGERVDAIGNFIEVVPPLKARRQKQYLGMSDAHAVAEAERMVRAVQRAASAWRHMLKRLTRPAAGGNGLPRPRSQVGRAALDRPKWGGHFFGRLFSGLSKSLRAG